MITFPSSELVDRRGMQFACMDGRTPLAYDEVLRRWSDDDSFAALFCAALAAVPYAAFRWETPGITAASAARAFEFVVLDSPEIDRRPDRQAFAEHFARAADAPVIEFATLGNDAVLVVPSPQADDRCYGHLGAFVRHAPAAQQAALWAAVGRAMRRRLGAKPVWLSTAGAGVSWLHVRLDDRPKYYGHAPFRRTSPA